MEFLHIFQIPCFLKLLKKLPNSQSKIKKRIENLVDNNILYSTILSGGTIIGLGILDETLNLTNGTKDLTDIIKYSLGVGTAAYYNFKYDK